MDLSLDDIVPDRWYLISGEMAGYGDAYMSFRNIGVTFHNGRTPARADRRRGNGMGLWDVIVNKEWDYYRNDHDVHGVFIRSIGPLIWQ